MKKLLSVLSSTLQGGARGVLLFMALLATTSLWAYDFQSGDLYYNITNDTIAPYTVEVTTNYVYGFYPLTTVIIPETVTNNGTTYSVTSIGRNAFQYSFLTSITIPNSVTSIGEDAFYNCSSIDTVVWNAKNCADFDSNGSPFSSEIRSFTFGNEVEHIPAYLCRYMKNLTFLTIPNSVTSIGGEAFRNCSSLTSITIPNSVTSIGWQAFYDCSSLTSVTIGNSVTSIGGSAFAYCSSLTSVTIPNSVTSIGVEAFSYCDSLKSVIWNVKNCEDFNSSCSWCVPFSYSPITSFIIGDSVEYIPAALLAYADTKNLTTLTIPESVTSIGENAFYKSSIDTVVWNAKNCADFEWHSAPFADSDSIILFSFGDSVKHIPAYLCRGMKNLTFLTIPKSVTSIGEDAFAYCSSIDTVVWNAKNCTDFNDYSYPPFFYSDSIASFTFGDSVEHIPADLCYDMENLTSITIPNSVTSIGEYAFSGCSSLTSVTIPNSVTSVEKYAFSYCSSVTSLTLGENLASIGEGAFTWLHALTSVTQKAPSIEAYCQGQVSKLLYDSAGLNDDAIRTIEINGEEVTDWVIPSSITKIEDYTFYNCPSITSVALPNTITSIGKSAFENCTSITAITIPNKVTRIGVRALSKCPITDIIIPNNVTNIGGSAFSNCDKLSSLILGESVDSIGSGAFYGCRKLYDIYCYAPEPPYAIASGWSPSFENFNVNLYVPCDNLKAFQMDPVFGTFKYIHCIDSEDVPADGVIITPGFTDVTITWPTDDDADNYTIVIEKDGEVVCTLTFNADGQLLNIAFAPGRAGNHPVQYAEQAGKGFRFTVTGLEEGVDYTYDVIVKDANNKNINTHSGRFTTQSHTAVDNITTDSANIQKIMRNGQLIILRDGIEYNAMGQEL